MTCQRRAARCSARRVLPRGQPGARPAPAWPAVGCAEQRRRQAARQDETLPTRPVAKAVPLDAAATPAATVARRDARAMPAAKAARRGARAMPAEKLLRHGAGAPQAAKPALRGVCQALRRPRRPGAPAPRPGRFVPQAAASAHRWPAASRRSGRRVQRRWLAPARPSPVPIAARLLRAATAVHPAAASPRRPMTPRPAWAARHHASAPPRQALAVRSASVPSG